MIEFLTCSKMVVFLMIKILILVSAFFLSSFVNATGENVCPLTLSCDYDSGVCDHPRGWILVGSMADENFIDQNPLNLTNIIAAKIDSSFSLKVEAPLSIICFYYYGEYSTIAIYKPMKELIGAHWVLYGFGKNKAYCSDISDPSSCTGIDFNGV